MKKTLLVLITALFFVSGIFAQTNSSVDLTDDVYEVLRFAEIKGYCSQLSSVKPYTKKYILNKLEEIVEYLENEDEDNTYEINLVQKQIEKYDFEYGHDLKNARVSFSNENEDLPITLIFQDSITGGYSAGVYDETDANSQAYEIWENLAVSGDIGKNVSWWCKGLVGAVSTPLQFMGEYENGTWLYHSSDTRDSRSINVYKNNSYLPYSYTKYWDGSCYYFGKIDAAGLEGWPLTDAFAFGMFGEVHASLLDNKIELGINRNFREWGAMDDGSSLILNSRARPFLAFETRFQPFSFFAISSITGALEYPNQGHITSNSYYMIDEDGKKVDTVEDSYFFQNAFSMTMIDFNFTHFHFDFGSAAVWPKRFELGYAFPLIDRVIYQNNTGDYDNLSLFFNMKFMYPGLGSLWLSGYLDEVNSMKSKFWEKTRAMYAIQAGTKFVLPFLPFTTASFRYTRVEPYCYTHHSINYVPYFDHYLSESYTNNGESLGYYLPPNSDEFHLKIESKAVEYSTFRLQYQLVRHGTDWGYGSVIGSNLYSELRNNDRSDLNKYFLKDGVYEWTNIVSLYGSYDFSRYKIPLKLYTTIGYVYDWFTQTSYDLEKIKNEDYDGIKQATYHYINNSEYNDKSGFVVTVGFSWFN